MVAISSLKRSMLHQINRLQRMKNPALNSGLRIDTANIEPVHPRCEGGPGRNLENLIAHAISAHGAIAQTIIKMQT
jgi:hypothetical protein